MTRLIRNESDLLIGMLALKRGLIDHVQLLSAFDVWEAGENGSMAEILVLQGALEESDVCEIKGEVDDAKRAISATVAYVRSDAGEEHRDGALSRADSVQGSRGSVGTSERYRVIRPHARGGLGEVFLAVDVEVDRQVALKELQAYHADDAQSQSRFLREARVTGRLEHPGIVPVYGVGRHGDGRPYYAMRFIEGETLKQAIERFHGEGVGTVGSAERALEFRRLLRSFIDACNAVAYGAQPRGGAPGPEAGEHHAGTIWRDAGRGLGCRQADRGWAGAAFRLSRRGWEQR